MCSRQQKSLQTPFGTFGLIGFGGNSTFPSFKFRIALARAVNGGFFGFTKIEEIFLLKLFLMLFF